MNIDTYTSPFAIAIGASSITFAHTSAGSDRYVLAFGLVIVGSAMTSATYDGVSMTSLGNAQRGPNFGSDVLGRIYGLHAQSTTTNANVVMTCSGASAWIEGAALSLTGALQQTAADASTFTTGPSQGASKSGTITTVTDNDAVLVWLFQDNGTYSGLTGLTQLFTGNGGGFGSQSIVCRSSTFPYTPAGAFSPSWSQNAASNWFFEAVAISPAGGASFTPTPMLHMLQMAGGIV